MIRALLAAGLLVLLAGCNILSCGATGSTNYGAGDCGFHTTFLASAAAPAHQRLLAKP